MARGIALRTVAFHVVCGLSAVRLVPHALLYWRTGSSAPLRADLARWMTVYRPGRRAGLHGFLWMMTFYPECRNLFYHRAGLVGKLFSPLCRPMATLFLPCEKIGPGLFIQHGFATIVAAREIGANCWINQQVTIGYSNATDCPVIGDNVTINAGAKVIGAVIVGDNVKVGANAVVVRDVPPNCTVVGVPARVVRRDGQRVSAGG